MSSRLARVIVPWAILASLGTVAVIGYVTMFDVRPRVARPRSGEVAQREIDALGDRLMRHVRILGGEIGERNVFQPRALAAAAAYIRQVWTGQGFSVAEEAYAVRGVRCANLVVEQPGTGRPGEIVLVGAHYDSVIGSPGADDNATGVALLLELATALRGTPAARTLRLVAFVNEEPPFFETELMGSRRHARAARARGDRIVAMLSLESLGYYDDAPGSQRYPFPLGLLYPSTGNFVGVVGNLRSRGLVRDILAAFTAATDFPAEGAATFAWIPGVDWSDHGSFWREGYPAVMLTDTALYRHPGYHTAGDRPDRVDATRLARVAYGIIEVVRRLAAAPAG